MNFLREKSLKQVGAYVIGLVILLSLSQYLILRVKISQLNEASRKIDFARHIQSSNQKLSLQIQYFLSGKNEDRFSGDAEIASLIDHQDYALKVLSQGGRVDGTEYFLSPLNRLAQITFQGLKEKWDEYKKSSLELITTPQENGSTEGSVAVDSLSTDSLAVTPSAASVNYNTSRVRYAGLALSLASWYDKLIVDLEEEVQKKNTAVTHWMIFLILFNASLLISIYFLFLKKILAPLKFITSNTLNHKHSFNLPKNEIGEVAHAINETIENLKDATDFVTSIGQGNLSLDYKEALDSNYVPGNNTLADSLIAMQSKLRTLNEEEQKRQWANEGLAKFVDILRASSDNIYTLGDSIISALVHYTKSNQGGLYILNDEDEQNKFLELISLFAFDIKKYEAQKIKLGEGILGQTFLEKETTYLANIPDEYVRITSGLGGANPKSILIVPLKVDQEVYGLVELASFNEYQSHEISFVEKLAETIGSTLANVRATQKNKQLIEQFQQQTEEMRAQEEEMRQNMEELQATQEEIARKEKSYLVRIQELESAAHSQVSLEELQSAREELSRKESDYRAQLEHLQKELSQKVAKSNGWEIAEELSKTLQINLEALKITQEELNQKK